MRSMRQCGFRTDTYLTAGRAKSQKARLHQAGSLFFEVGACMFPHPINSVFLDPNVSKIRSM